MSTPSPQRETVTSTQKTEPWSEQIPYLKQGFSEAQNLYNQGPQQFYQGQTYANPDAATTQGLNQIQNIASAGSPVISGAQNEATKVLSGAYLDPSTNPAWGSMVDSVRANVLPGIDSRFMGAGRSGSGLHGRAVGEGLGSAIGQLAYQNYGAERANMANTMNNAGNIAQAQYLDPSMLLNVGAAREGQAQQGINEAIARHDFSQMAPGQALDQFLQRVQGNYGGQTTGTTQQLIPQANPWMQALGIASSAAGAGLGMYAKSDVRAKEDIKRVGETDDGLPIYTYRYKSGGPPMMGVMAQEVAQVKPEAVAMRPDGYLGVDYGAL